MPLRNQTRERNRQVFEGWLVDHEGIIVKIVRGFTVNAADAADLTQDISLALWRSVPLFRGESKPSTWIWRISLNQAISWKRKSAPIHAGLDDIAEPSAPDRADEALLVDRIYAAIRGLAPVDRSLIMLSLEGHRYAEIAEITGLTESNVGARLTRARTLLTTQLQETP